MNLLSQLKLYGLNPKDWNLKLKFVKPHEPLIASLQHKDVEDLRLEGLCKIADGSPRLEFSSLSLQLLH